MYTFWQLYPIVARALNKPGATSAVAKDVPTLSTGFCMLVFYKNFGLMEFQVRYLALFRLSSVIDSFGWFWMEGPYKNIQLMVKFFKVQFLVQHFPHYTMTF